MLGVGVGLLVHTVLYTCMVILPETANMNKTENPTIMVSQYTVVVMLCVWVQLYSSETSFFTLQYKESELTICLTCL